MVFINLNTGESIEFYKLKRCLRPAFLRFWERNNSYKTNIETRYSNRNYKFKFIIENEQCLKLSVLFQENFSKVYSYESIYALNHKENQQLTLWQILSEVEREFYLESEPFRLNPTLNTNCIYKFSFNKLFYIPEDVLLEIDIYALAFIKLFIGTKYKKVENNENYTNPRIRAE